MQIETKKIKIYTGTFNYSAEIGSKNVFVYRGNSEISVDDLNLEITIESFGDLEKVASNYELNNK